MVRLHSRSWSRRWIRDHCPEVAVRLGFVNGVSSLRKFGKNLDVDNTGLPETVWNDDGLYPFQAGTFSLEVLSSSIEDGAGGSTGALTLTAQGLAGNDWLLAEETVTLNGTGIVTFARTDWRRIFRAFVVTTGSAGSNVGTITIRLASAGATQAVLSADRGQTQQAMYTIAGNLTGLITSWQGNLAKSGSAAEMELGLFTRDNSNGGGAWRLRGTIGLRESGTSSYIEERFDAPIIVGSKTDIDIRITENDTVNSSVCSTFEILMVETALIS